MKSIKGVIRIDSLMIDSNSLTVCAVRQLPVRNEATSFGIQLQRTTAFHEGTIKGQRPTMTTRQTQATRRQRLQHKEHVLHLPPRCKAHSSIPPRRPSCYRLCRLVQTSTLLRLVQWIDVSCMRNYVPLICSDSEACRVGKARTRRKH